MKTLSLILFLIALYLYKREYISKVLKTIALKRKSRSNGSMYSLLKLMHRKNISTDPLKQEYSGNLRGGTIYFESLRKRFVNNIPLKSIKFVHRDGHGYYRWEASRSEYDRVYNSTLYKFLEEKLAPLYKQIFVNLKNPQYQSVLNRYELALSTISVAIEESESRIGYVTREVEQKTIHILEQFISEIEKIKIQDEDTEKMLKDATNKSISEMLDVEIEHLKI
ncbi:hypothetical protein ABE073_05050 [Lederbergia citrisecunda]|uniref:hypothetical protein n=1 Tax=Lederbergia citrisecunda TaxID=2833583 RepID=UPI003D280ADE